MAARRSIQTSSQRRRAVVRELVGTLAADALRSTLDDADHVGPTVICRAAGEAVPPSAPRWLATRPPFQEIARMFSRNLCGIAERRRAARP
jgi:hypothetical protein